MAEETRLRLPSAHRLALASGVALGLLWVDAAVARAGNIDFLWWNLLLAWVPYVLARLLRFARRRHVPGPALMLVGAVWLVFLPNAPYLVTDFVHVRNRGGLLWLDIATVGVFAAVGLALGFVSLALVQATVRAAGRDRAAALVGIVAAALCGAGIYLGRVAQLNSWDIVARPSRLLATAAAPLVDPAAHLTAVVGTIVAGALLAASYAAACRLLPARLRGTVERS